ncbi:hypothetical protein WA026_007725 [Henosepilachna vigintioctopunctata]|uniref:Uncharacterized protein n=1 Tax=Henosepilachna vigintioctopunctata TaxID=420089 RepID=A0AAW1U4Z5_9CUCU
MLEPSKNRASDDKATGRKRTGLEKKLFIGIAVVAVIALVFLILYATKKTCSVSEEECTTKYCVKAASELLDFVDLKNDPCEDFYHYVCGHYIKDAVKKGAPTPILEIEEQFKNEMKSYIVDPIRTTKDTKANVAMKKFYQACMNESKMDNDKDQTFKTALEELGGWPLIGSRSWNDNTFDWLNWHIKSHRNGVPIIGFFSFKSAEAKNNKTILRVSASKLANLDISRTNFEAAMRDIATHFGAPDGFGSENIQVYNFLETVKKISRDADLKEESDDEEEVSTVANLYRDCPQIPWLKLLNGLSEGVREFKNDSEILYGSMKLYCHGLDDLLKKTPKVIIADYFVWSIIHNTHEFLSSDIRSAYEILDSSNSDKERYQVCFDLTDERFKYLKETLYIRKRTKTTIRGQLEELIGIMKEVFIEHIKASTWMDEETKTNGIRKTKEIKDLIGADDLLYDVEKFDKVLGLSGLEFSSDNPYKVLMERNIRENVHIWEALYEDAPDNYESFFSNVNDVNAFFAIPLNMMIVPAPILTSVFFNYKMPAFMNYGSIGRVIGHEIMHGFGEDGRHVLINDTEEVDWWTNKTAENFNKTKQCAIKEYESMPFRYRLNGTLTLEENMADLVGIDVAYEAYERWVKKYGEEKRLPGIPLSPKQIFWIQTGTFLCFRKLDDDATDLEAEDVHAVPKFRVMAGARNSRYFAKDFNCPEGSLMNPKEKCRIL